MNTAWTWRALADEQIERIRSAALDHIGRHGFAVQHAPLLNKARARGARVDEAQGRVRIPRALCAELLALAPRRYPIGNILGETWEMGGEAQHGLAIVTDPWIIDFATGAPRHPCLEDVRRHTIIAEQLEPIAAVTRMDYPVTDVAGPTSSLRALETHLLHHTRHNLIVAASLASFDQWTAITGMLDAGGAAGRLFSSGIAVVSPMVLNALNAELLTRSVERGFALTPTVCPMAGATAPYTLAGTLLQAHIETLMVVLMAQIASPGHPVNYVSGLSVSDLRNGDDLYYTLDKVLWKLAAVQLGRAEGLPTSAECGGTMTHRTDLQSGAEGMLFMLAAHAAGAHMLAGFGSCCNAVGMSAEMMIVQAAYLRAARHLSRGIRLDEKRLATEALARVGPGGQFMDDALTLEMMRSDEFLSDGIFDIGGPPGGGRPMLVRAHERAEELVSGFESRVPHAIQERLRRYFHDLCGKLNGGHV